MKIILLFMSAMLLLLACDDVPTEPIDDDPPVDSLPTDGIVFVRYRADSLSSMIMFINSDGSGLDTILPLDYLNLMPQVSPDGRRIVFVSNLLGKDNLFTMYLDSGHIVRLTHSEHYVYNPAWSADGSKICYERYLSPNYHLHSINSYGGGLVDYNREKPTPFTPIWSAAGDSIYYTGSNGIIYQTSSTEPDSAAIAYAIGINDPLNIVFSPDGQSLLMDALVFGVTDTVRSMFLGDLSGVRPVNISFFGSYDEYPDWSPDGTQVVFQSRGSRGREADIGLYTTVPGSSERFRIPNTGIGDTQPHWFSRPTD